MRKVLVVYAQRCTGCRLCEQWCSWTHHAAVNPARSRISIQRVHSAQVNVPVACAQCSQAPCVTLCPEQAITRDPVSGGLQLDADKCVGCRLCVDVCPRGCIKVDAEAGVPLLCDLCGGDPQCARHCPEAAVAYVDVDKLEHAALAAERQARWLWPDRIKGEGC